MKPLCKKLSFHFFMLPLLFLSSTTEDIMLRNGIPVAFQLVKSLHDKQPSSFWWREPFYDIEKGNIRYAFKYINYISFV